MTGKFNKSVITGRYSSIVRFIYFFTLVALVFFAAPPACLHAAAERIVEDAEDSLDLISTQNFGSLNLITEEVKTDNAAKNAAALKTTENNIYQAQPSGQNGTKSSVEVGVGHGASVNAAPAANVSAASHQPPAPVNGQVSSGKTSEADLMSQLMGEETFEVIGSSAALNPKAEEYFKTGTDLFNQKQYVEAKKYFEKAATLEPKNDVYLLTLDMVNSTMKSQGIKASEEKGASGGTAQGAKNGKSNISPEIAKAINGDDGGLKASVKKYDNRKKNAGVKTKPKVKTQVFTCAFENRAPVGNIIFNLGVNTEIKNSDISGNYVNFDNEKDALALGVFRLDCEPKRAIMLVTQKIFTDDNNFVFPLMIKVNNVEVLNGAFRLSNDDFRLYQFDITEAMHYGLNQILFQTAPHATSNYGLLRVEVFVQNY